MVMPEQIRGLTVGCRIAVVVGGSCSPEHGGDELGELDFVTE